MGDLSLVRCLGRHGIPVVLATDDVRGTTARSRYVREVIEVSSGGAPELALQRLDAFAAGCKEAPVLFYQGDDDLLLVSRRRDALLARFRFVLPPAELVEDMVDKMRFAALAERAGLPVPRTLVLRRGEPAPPAVASWEWFPAVLKPAHRHGWFGSPLHAELAGDNRKAVRIGDRRELLRCLPAIRSYHTDFILQEAVEGGEERIVSHHAYVRPDGQVAGEFTGRKLRTYPRVYGLSTCVEITDDAEVRAAGRRVLEQLGFTGVVKLDFKRDARDGRLWLLEMNPRFTLWNHPGARAGVDLPRLVYDDLTGGPRRVAGPARAGVRWMAVRADLRSALSARAAGEGSLRRWAWQCATASVREDLMLTDPMPTIHDLAGVVARRWRRGAAPIPDPGIRREEVDYVPRHPPRGA
jgi:predicted ATP-grasp superfamily ATP-dependent carboligase